MSDISIYGMPILSEEEHCNKVPFTKILASTGCDQNGEGFASFIDIDSLDLDPADIIQIMVDYFNQSGVQVPTAAEVCAYIGSLPQKTPLVATDKIVLGSCEYGTIADLLVYIQSNLLIKTCQDVIDCVEAEPSLALQNVSTNNLTIAGELELPASEVSFTTSGNTATLVIGNQTQTAPIINSNDLSNAGLAITSNVNGIADNIDITSDVQALITSNTDSVTNTVAGHLIATHTAVDNTVININETVTSLGDGTLTGTVVSIPFTNENGTTINSNTDLAGLMNSAVFQSNDDQVLTAGATSDMDVQLVPTTVTDPDSQTDKINYEISVTPKPTVICSGNPLSATNKLLTSDTLDPNTTVPTTVVATPDPTIATNEFVKAVKVNVGCNEDVYVPIPDLGCADLTLYQEGINTPPLLTKSLLGDEPGSVPTVINVNTPIIVSTDPLQKGVLTNGTSIVIPKETTPFLVAIPSTQIVTDGAIGVYTNGLPFINFTYSNTSSRSQLIEFNAYGVIYTFLSSGAAQYEVKYDNYTKFLSSLPDENGETLFNQGLGQQNIAPAGLGGNIEQSYSFVFKKILNAGQSITFTLWSQIGNFSGLPTTNTVFSGIPGVTHKSFLVTPL